MPHSFKAWSRHASSAAAISLASILPASGFTQSAAVPPIRQLGPRLGVTRDSLGSVTSVRGLSDGRVLVVDGIKHQLLLYDSALTHARVVADSTPSTKNAFGNSKWAAVIPYRGDSTVFVDPNAIALLVIDPQGRIVRTIAPPDPQQLGSLIPVGPYGGGGAFDAMGRLVYRLTGVAIVPPYLSPEAVPSVQLARQHSRASDGEAAAPVAPRQKGDTTSLATRDSGFLVRGSLQTRAVDTIGFLVRPVATRPGARADSMFVDPIPVYDDWAVTADGSVALVRALDYHIDWINADGGRSSTPRITHTWGPRLNDSAKAEIVDSARKMMTAWRDSSDSAILAQDKGRGRPPIQPIAIMEASGLADYLPPFTQGAVKADADNNLWIRQGWSPRPPAQESAIFWLVPPPAFTASEPPIYDVVNRQGQLVDRIQLPPSLTLVGFGPGVVYLTSREGFGTVVVKYRIR